MQSEGYPVGEVMWDEWPDHTTNTEPWLCGNVLGAVKSYRWSMQQRSFSPGAPPHLTTTGYVTQFDSVSRDIAQEFHTVMINLAASQDSPPSATSVNHAGLDVKYQEGPRGNYGYRPVTVSVLPLRHTRGR